MAEIKLQAQKREILGKKTRFLRREGKTPAHLFGHDVASQTLQCDTAQVQKIIAAAGMTRLINLSIAGEKTPKNVFIKEIQRDAISRRLLHVDFYQVKKGEKIKMEIPIVLVGEAPALKAKGNMLIHGITSLHIESLPENIPSEIKVDISGLVEVEKPISVRDLVLDPDVTVLAEPEQLVVKVSEAVVKEIVEEAPAEEVAAEVPVVGKEEKEGEAPAEEAAGKTE